MTIVCRVVNFNEENAMRCSLERELEFHANGELLATKEEPQDDVEQPHLEETRSKEWMYHLVVHLYLAHYFSVHYNYGVINYTFIINSTRHWL